MTAGAAARCVVTGDRRGRGPGHRRRCCPTRTILTLTSIPVEPIALVVGAPARPTSAVQVLASRDARRFVVGLGVAVVAWFAILYPNISALPLPSAVVAAYQGILPTYLYAFQFPVSTGDPQRPTRRCSRRCWRSC